MRPLFPEGFYNEVQIIATVLSCDSQIDSDIPAMIGASAALALSGLPFNGPLGAARVGYVDGQYVLNPTQSELRESKLDLVVAGTESAVLMVESEAQELPEDVMLGAVVFGHDQMRAAIDAINDLADEAGKDDWAWNEPETPTALNRAHERLVCRRPNRSAVEVDDPFDHRQAQSRTVPRRFGCEEGVEDLRQEGLRYAGSGVVHLRDRQSVAGLEMPEDALLGGQLLGPLNQTAGHSQGAALRHGVQGVDEKVDEDLLHFGAVHENQGQVRGQPPHCSDAGRTDFAWPGIDCRNYISAEDPFTPEATARRSGAPNLDYSKAKIDWDTFQAPCKHKVGLPAGMNLPDELARRETRLAAIAAAKDKIEARARERFAHEQAEHEAKLRARQARAAATGKKPRGKEPKPPQPGPRPEDQFNLTDDDSRIMPLSGGGFEQCYNAQALVDTDSLLVLATRITQAPNDKEQLQPMLAVVRALPDGLNSPDCLSAYNDFCSEANIVACQAAGIQPLIALQRDTHHPHWRERFGEPAPLASEATPLETMAHALKTRVGKARYALRKQTVEPVFGIIKAAMGFRQFLLRGLARRDPGMDAGLPGLESETHGRIASITRHAPKRGDFHPKMAPSGLKLPFKRLSASLTTLNPTGC